MLYIWPYFMFFSFPLLYPYILNSIIPQASLPAPLRSGSTKHQLPRVVVAIPIMAIMLATVHFNTIVHPFTLADNRHYVFYVFRILLRHPSIKYLAVPVYFVCAWAAITALGGLPNEHQPTASHLREKKVTNNKPDPSNSSPQNPPHQANTITFVLVWLLATSLSLITAPLVEPRYFIVPWLIWRLHIPTPPPESTTTPPPTTSSPPTTSPPPTTTTSPPTTAPRNNNTTINPLDQLKSALYKEYDHRLWLETAWFLAVNGVTGYVFLYRGFEWEQEGGVVMRFMW